MKKLLLLILFLTVLIGVSAPPLFAFADSTPTQVRVVFNQTRIYSTSDLSTLTTTQQVDAATIRMAMLHEVFTVKSQTTDLYEIELESASGYISKIAVIDHSLSSPEAILQTNAKTITNVVAYEKIGDTFYKHEEMVIAKDTRVRILNGYDKGKEFTLVSYQKENITYSHYVKTALLDPDGIDRSIILAVSLIIACVSGGLVLLKIFKPKIKIKN